MNGDSNLPPSPEASPGAFSSELRKAVGCLCEVRKPDNTLVFLGRVRDFDGRAVSVWPAGGKEAPPTIYNDEYKLVLRITGMPALVWRGFVCGSSRSFWKLDHLVRYHYKEQRSSFRQPIALVANLLCINAMYPDSRRGSDEYFARLCRVTDVSLGGLQLRSQDSYYPGDHLLVMNLFLDPSSKQPFVFTLQVRWAEQLSVRDCRLGCSFETMSILDEDRLCGAILGLQREDLANH